MPFFNKVFVKFIEEKKFQINSINESLENQGNL